MKKKTDKEIDLLRAEVARLNTAIGNVMFTAELSATINVIFSNALIAILAKRMSRDDLIGELRLIPLRCSGGRPELVSMANNVLAQLIAGIDGRNVSAAGHA